MFGSVILGDSSLYVILHPLLYNVSLNPNIPLDSLFLEYSRIHIKLRQIKYFAAFCTLCLYDVYEMIV
jgi:hypothetical protein